MRFEESSGKFIENENKYLIYFLLKGEIVVYVGQTSNGLYRPLSHRNKEYDGIYVISVNENELLYKETEFILKYDPIYNKEISGEICFSLEKTKRYIQNKTNDNKFGMVKLKKKLKELNMNENIFNYKGVSYLYKNHVDYLICCL